jgi:hypothetical protein
MGDVMRTDITAGDRSALGRGTWNVEPISAAIPDKEDADPSGANTAAGDTGTPVGDWWIPVRDVSEVAGEGAGRGAGTAPRPWLLVSDLVLGTASLLHGDDSLVSVAGNAPVGKKGELWGGS